MVLGKNDMFIYSWKKWQLEKVTVGKNDFGKNVALPISVALLEKMTLENLTFGKNGGWKT